MNMKDVNESIRQNRRELVRLYRQRASLYAKKYRNMDPHQIAVEERLKALKREAYCRAKEEINALKAEQTRTLFQRIAMKKAASRRNLVGVFIVDSPRKSGKNSRNTI